MNAMTNDLLALAPCPFCGGSNISRDLYIRDGRMVKCQGCGASTYDYNPNASTGAIAKWNTRAAATRAPALDREVVAQALCKSGKFETGQGTCALICMDQLGDIRKKGCGHCARVHGKIADTILSLLRTALAAEQKEAGK